MIVSLEPGGPSGGADARGGSTTAQAEAASAWQREMEKAMQLAWFDHGLVGGAHPPAQAAHIATQAQKGAAKDATSARYDEAAATYHHFPADLDALVQMPARIDNVPDAAPPPSPPILAVPSAPRMSGSAPLVPVSALPGQSTAALAPPTGMSVSSENAGSNTAPATQDPHVDVALIGCDTQPHTSPDLELPAALAAPVTIDALDLSAPSGRLVAQFSRWLGLPVALETAAGVPPAAAPAPPRADLPASTTRAPLAAEPAEPGEEGASTDAPRVASRAKSPIDVAPAEQPVRLHAEWSDVGVRLWLGMDTRTHTEMADLMPQLLRWLAAEGWSLLSVVCNGRSIYQSRSVDGVTRDMGETPAAARTRETESTLAGVRRTFEHGATIGAADQPFYKETVCR